MTWLCDWCKIYGKFPVSKAWQPDNVEPVITKDGEKICPDCAKAWLEGKKKQEKS